MKRIIGCILLILCLNSQSTFAYEKYVSDKKYLKETQYTTASNYQQRLEVFKYGELPPPLAWSASLFHREISLQGKKILELGAGTGELWQYLTKNENFTAADVTLTDISEGMLQSCKHSVMGVLNNKENNIEVSYKIVDMDNLAELPDNTYDVIIAHQVIYHAQNPRKVLTEIRRLLKPNGYLGLAVVEENSSKGLWELGHQVDARIPTKGFPAVFCEKQVEGEKLLAPFAQCNTHYYQNKLSFDESAMEVPLNSFKSSPTIAGLALSEAVFEKMREKMRQKIKQEGAFEYTYLERLYICQK